MRAAANKRDHKAEGNVGADHLGGRQRGEAEQSGAAQRACSGRGEADLRATGNISQESSGLRIARPRSPVRCGRKE